ncbi:uncharacterized protein METZ01_LOCUS288145 [marine metagenome]|uniref:Tyr recombinase domain-containing protein n=1 Tax=marine metagenome TaxID=408172 RepID=A0A382LKA4_9ZZZZ
MAKAVYDFIIKNGYSFNEKLEPVELFDSLIRNKFKEPLSVSYLKTLTCLARTLKEELVSKGKISLQFINSIPLRYNNNTSYNTTRRHLNVLVNYLYENNFPIERSKLKSRKQEETLHKPIDNVKKLLAKVKAFNEDLYLCCLFTYGCLLRPHQEIRLLKWEDFTSDLSHIRLSGNQVKSKRNRIVPVSLKIREILKRKEGHLNIFTGLKQPYSRSYFIQLWRRFKRLNPEVDREITLYSFRHSGAIDIFKRTGSITKLQKAMGHSSMTVSLTYLRGLEVAELKEGDMPMI